MASRKMIKKIKWNYRDRGPDYEVDMTVNLDRFEQQYNRAQYLLDNAVMTSMIPFMPMLTGTFVNVTRAMSATIAGSGKVYAAAPPYGRFLYKGKVMVSPSTGSTYAKYGEKKVLISQYSGQTKAAKELEYNKTAHPNVQSEWYDAAKKAYGKTWVRKVKQTAGGGKRG